MIEAIVKMISWVRTNRVNISYRRLRSVRRRAAACPDRAVAHCPDRAVAHCPAPGAGAVLAVSADWVHW